MPCINCEYGNKHCDNHGEYTGVECLYPENVKSHVNKELADKGPMHSMYYSCSRFEAEKCYGEWG